MRVVRIGRRAETRGTRPRGRHLVRRLLPCCLAAVLTLGAAGPDSAATLWRARAAGFDTGQLDPRPVDELIALLERRLAADPRHLETRFELARALYFRGHFLTHEAAEKRRIYEHLVELTEATLTLASDADCPDPGAAAVASRGDSGDSAETLARGHFWAAIAWGLWGMSHSRLSAASRDVAGKIRDHAEQVIELDPEFADGGGYRLLGRLHTDTPKIVFFTGWIDRDLGLELLERAHRISTADPRNSLFLADALLRFRPEQRRRALELLAEVAGRAPHPERLLEESETIAQARALLAQEQAR